MVNHMIFFSKVFLLGDVVLEIWVNYIRAFYCYLFLTVSTVVLPLLVYFNIFLLNREHLKCLVTNLSKLISFLLTPSKLIAMDNSWQPLERYQIFFFFFLICQINHWFALLHHELSGSKWDRAFTAVVEGQWDNLYIEFELEEVQINFCHANWEAAPKIFCFIPHIHLYLTFPNAILLILILLKNPQRVTSLDLWIHIFGKMCSKHINHE